MILSLTGKTPLNVRTESTVILQPNITDTAMVHMEFEAGLKAKEKIKIIEIPKIGIVNSMIKPLGSNLKRLGVDDNILLESLDEEQAVITMGDAIEKSLKVLKQMSNLIRDTRKLILEKIEPKDFENLAHDIAMQVAAMDPKYVSETNNPTDDGVSEDSYLVRQPFIKDPSKSIQDVINETVGKLGENIRVRRFKRFSLGE